MRAVDGVEVKSLSDLTKFREEEVLQLHGMEPNAILKLALKSNCLSFAKIKLKIFIYLRLDLIK